MAPIWIVVGPDDFVYIADHSGRVQRPDAEGNVLEVWSDPGNGDNTLTCPSPLSLDTEANLYVGSKDRATVYVLRP